MQNGTYLESSLAYSFIFTPKVMNTIGTGIPTSKVRKKKQAGVSLRGQLLQDLKKKDDFFFFSLPPMMS